ncbi:MAG: ImmA/IrrE family metallo-endopeptidase [Bacillota bacterium]|nr:ImmA/IrrE family metallo-endopeptidase [Bacillota bacterium]
MNDWPPKITDVATGAYLPRKGEPWIMWIMMNAAADDPLFTLAHELAHHELHQSIDYALYDSDRTYECHVENEADTWARNLLAGSRSTVHLDPEKGATSYERRASTDWYSLGHSGLHVSDRGHTVRPGVGGSGGHCPAAPARSLFSPNSAGANSDPS